MIRFLFEVSIVHSIEGNQLPEQVFLEMFLM